MVQWRYENDITHRQSFHSPDELIEVTAQPRKVNLKNGKFVSQSRLVKRFLMTNSGNNDINVCLFQRIIYFKFWIICVISFSYLHCVIVYSFTIHANGVTCGHIAGCWCSFKYTREMAVASVMRHPLSDIPKATRCHRYKVSCDVMYTKTVVRH